MGRGPLNDGLCGKGDVFICIGHSFDDGLLCLSETVRTGESFHSYPMVDKNWIRGARSRDIVDLGWTLVKHRVEVERGW